MVGASTIFQAMRGSIGDLVFARSVRSECCVPQSDTAVTVTVTCVGDPSGLSSGRWYVQQIGPVLGTDKVFTSLILRQSLDYSPQIPLRRLADVRR